MPYKNPRIPSSYRKNNLGTTLYETVLSLKPLKIVEFGCLNGYSTVCMAMALKELGEGILTVYDLYEEYPYKHASRSEVWKNIEKYGLQDYVRLEKGDFYQWIRHPEPFDLLHVDISNDGDIIELLDRGLRHRKGGVVLFEGGTKERDEVDWMIKYGKKAINSCPVNYKIINTAFPGISRL